MRSPWRPQTHGRQTGGRRTAESREAGGAAVWPGAPRGVWQETGGQCRAPLGSPCEPRGLPGAGPARARQSQGPLGPADWRSGGRRPSWGSHGGAVGQSQADVFMLGRGSSTLVTSHPLWTHQGCSAGHAAEWFGQVRALQL